MSLPNPLLPGFNPDPSVCRVGDDYFIVTSTFEYVPALPVYHSRNLVDWQHIGNISYDAPAIGVAECPTNMGVWAPTIRHWDGVFHVVVVVAGHGCLHFTAHDPAGPWSAPQLIAGIGGIDPDLAWGDDGTPYITYSGLILSGDEMGRHLGIQQVKVDLVVGKALEEPRSLWSGTGGIFPEAPHLYRRGDTWYLMVAEGGTERGHAVSIARGPSPEGPFESNPANPILTARGTARPVQNTGHGDLVETDQGTLMVLLGVRPRGMVRSFSALGRETFCTPVTWEDGWPVAQPVELNTRDGWSETITFDRPLDPGWIGIRQEPGLVSQVFEQKLSLIGRGTPMDHEAPVFVGRRQQHQSCTYSVDVEVDGIGGLSVRYDEWTHYDIEVGAGPEGTHVTARAVIPTLRQEWRAPLASGRATLVLESLRPEGAFGLAVVTCDVLRLKVVGEDGVEQVLAEIDGRHLSAETAGSFTGRVVGVYCDTGRLECRQWRYRGDND